MSHWRDCRERQYRLVDNYRGYRCDGEWRREAGRGAAQPGRQDPEPWYSSANTVFAYEHRGDRVQVNMMAVSGSVAAQVYKTIPKPHWPTLL